MKLAIILLVCGAALALPQNFYFSFPPKDGSPYADNARFRGPLNAQPAPYGLVPFNGLPVYENDPVVVTLSNLRLNPFNATFHWFSWEMSRT